MLGSDSLSPSWTQGQELYIMILGTVGCASVVGVGLWPPQAQVPLVPIPFTSSPPTSSSCPGDSKTSGLTP